MGTSKNWGQRSRSTLSVGNVQYELFSLPKVASEGLTGLASQPYSLRILCENLLRREDGSAERESEIRELAEGGGGRGTEIGFQPARIVLQDFTGVPAIVDLAAMRESYVRLGGDAAEINPEQQVDLVIDHSVQVDDFASSRALETNIAKEFARNKERYAFLKWGQQAFRSLQVVPPGTGIVHQVNLEYLAQGVICQELRDSSVLIPDTLVGTDSHTTMINGLGVLGWGVGGIEAEAAMLGQPIAMLIPEVVGFELKGRLPEGATATDLVLTVTQTLRAEGVVGSFVEFFGEGIRALSLPDRATIANMAPEYGATMGFFPCDEETLRYLQFTGRSQAQVERVRRYFDAQGLLYKEANPKPVYNRTIVFELGSVVPSLAGPKRPQDRIALSKMKPAWRKTLVEVRQGELSNAQHQQAKAWSDDAVAPTQPAAAQQPPWVHSASIEVAPGQRYELRDGAVALAAITSCTNTSNPRVMLAAGLLARNARRRGLSRRPWVKTSLAPGSQVVTEYLREADLLSPLEELGFHVVGYGCTTCIGNSGPLPQSTASAVEESDLVLAAVLSGNRNFEGRVNPLVRANYLASPPLVVAYALAGTVDLSLETEALTEDRDGKPVYLRELWPSPEEITETLRRVVKREQFIDRYGDVGTGPEAWQAIEASAGQLVSWDESSTYVRRPPFFDGLTAADPAPLADLEGMRVLALLGDSVTTDHISPAGAIAPESPAARYLLEAGVSSDAFNSYGSRRGNHEVMVRGTFGNIRLRNRLAPGTEGGFTQHQPSGDTLSIFDAAERYRQQQVPLLVLAGKEYGTGSSRDWAAKGTLLLGVRAVIAQSFERIHRSNLVGMGVLPLEFVDGQSAESLNLSGHEVYTVAGLSTLSPRATLEVRADDKTFEVRCRVDSAMELDYLRHGGILPYVLRNKARAAGLALGA